MTHDLESLRRAIIEQLPVFMRGKLTKFEQAIRADATGGFTIRWDGKCWVARSVDAPHLSVAAISANDALADLQMALTGELEAQP